MTWRIVNAAGRGIESHGTPKAAERALMILSAHEIKNGRFADYRIEPLITIPSTLDELDLPDWVWEVLEQQAPEMKEARRGQAET
jgi:hypothetical protein